ncbi:MAG: helix-turn-helix domain-containing protein [Slackia sp.]|nr:helix-turn-helix domain-containing protein [Slackia sp.]
MEVAQRLASIRRKRGYSQEALAQELGLTRQAVSKWERAEASPDTDNLIALARLYGMGLDELLCIGADIEDDVAFEHASRLTSTSRGEMSSYVENPAEDSAPVPSDVSSDSVCGGDGWGADTKRASGVAEENRAPATAIIESITKSILKIVVGAVSVFAAFLLVMTVVSRVFF